MDSTPSVRELSRRSAVAWGATLTLLVSLAACGAPADPTDAEVSLDAGGPEDAAPRDASPDARASDAGAPRDAAPPDAGEVRCAVPAGADPAVGAAVPTAGYRCERLPFPLASPRDVLVAASGEIFVTEFGAGRIVRLEPDGFATIAEGLRGPIGLRELTDSDLVVAEEFAGTVARIDRDTGARAEVAGGLGSVTYLSHGPDAALYVSSFREVAPTGTGVVHRVTLAGERAPYATGLHVPEGLFFDGDALVVVDWQRPTRVARFELGGAESTVTTDLSEAYGLSDDGAGGILVGDHAGRVLRVRADGSSEVWLDGIGRPGGITREPDGTVWIAEFVNFGATGYLVAMRPL